MEKLALKGAHTKEDFLRFYKKCKDIRLKERYHAMYLSFTYDWKEIAEILGRDYETVLGWAKAYNEGGLQALNADKPPGRTSSLTNAQQSELKRTVQMSPRKLGFKFGNWNCKNLSWWILKKFRIRLKREAVRLLLHRLGFVLIKPTYKYVLADKHERKRFLRRFRHKCKSLSCSDLLMFLDEASVKQHPMLKAKWMLRGSKEYVKTFGNHAKTNIFGAITALGDVFHMKSAKQNSGVFIKFLEHLMALNPKKRLVLVIDNAPWHKSKKVQKFLDKVQDRIQVLLLPAYSPDLNPIEHLWKFMRCVVANVFFLKIKDLNNALTDFFKSLYSRTEKILSLCSPDYLLG
jgi:putative transposase